MKNMKSRKNLLIITVALVLAFTVNKVNAATITPDTITNNTTTNTATNTAVNSTTKPTNVISSPTNTVTNNTTTNTSNYNTTKLPQTGAEDYTPVFIIMGVCIIAAGFAYKKMNDYRKL